MPRRPMVDMRQGGQQFLGGSTIYCYPILARIDCVRRVVPDLQAANSFDERTRGREVTFDPFEASIYERQFPPNREDLLCLLG